MFDGTLYTTEIEHDGGIADVRVTVNHDGTETATIRARASRSALMSRTWMTCLMCSGMRAASSAVAAHTCNLTQNKV
jgi:hypothetical protein